MTLEPQTAAWHPIADYESAPTLLARGELRSLSQVWREQRTALETLDALRQFNERLRREWAIETGLIERVYTLDRGVTQLLVERGFDEALIPHGHKGQNSADVTAILRDHQAVVEGLFAFVRGDRPLSTSYIKELHAQLTRHQTTAAAVDSQGRRAEIPLRHGDFKIRPNNPTRPDGSQHQYCPPEQVAAEMDRLLEMHAGHGEIEPEVEAAWLHHRFTQIHPFQDGNGRVARALATLVLLKTGWFPLVIRDQPRERTRYLDALEQADRGDLAPLVGVFAASQKRAFVEALGISEEVLRQTRIDQAIQATGAKLRRLESRSVDWNDAKTLIAGLESVAEKRLSEVATALAEEIREVRGTWCETDSEPFTGERSHLHRWQVLETAKYLGYFANLNEYRAWSRLKLFRVGLAEIFLSFHGAGREPRGVLAISATFFRHEETQIVDLTPLSEEIFQVNYLDEAPATEQRFREWLDDILVRGLELWRKTF